MPRPLHGQEAAPKPHFPQQCHKSFRHAKRHDLILGAVYDVGRSVVVSAADAAVGADGCDECRSGGCGPSGGGAGGSGG